MPTEVAEGVMLLETIECAVPCALGEAHASGYLWHRPKPSGAWRRRYAVCASSFLVLFAEKDAPSREEGSSSREEGSTREGAAVCAKPVGAICFEDLEATPIEPPPTEKDVAPFASFAFSLDPTPGPAADRPREKNTFFSSGSASRHAQLCAESEAEMQQWLKVLLIWRYTSLCEDRCQLATARTQLAATSERLVSAERDATDAKAEAAGHAAASEATHAQVLAVEADLRSTRAALDGAQTALARAESARNEAVGETRKVKIFAALHKAAREKLQRDADALRAQLAQQPTSAGKGGKGVGFALPDEPGEPSTAEGGGRRAKEPERRRWRGLCRAQQCGADHRDG